MSEFTHENFSGCTDAELAILNQTLDLLNAAENYGVAPEDADPDEINENDRRNGDDIMDVVYDNFTTEGLLERLAALYEVRHASDNVAARALATFRGTVG